MPTPVIHSEKECFYFLFLWILILASCNLKQSAEQQTFDKVEIYTNTGVWEIAKAISKGDTAAFTRLIASADLEILSTTDSVFGMNLLHWTIREKKEAAASLLLAKGLPINEMDSQGNTPLILASMDRENTYLLDEVLKYNPDVNLVSDKNIQNRTALEAAAGRSLENVKILIRSGAKIEYYDNDSVFRSALVEAWAGNNMDVLHYLIIEKKATVDKVLLFSGSKIEDMLRDMTSPLNSESYKLKMEIVDYLATKGIDYWSSPVPKHLYRVYDSAYLKVY